MSPAGLGIIRGVCPRVAGEGGEMMLKLPRTSPPVIYRHNKQLFDSVAVVRITASVSLDPPQRIVMFAPETPQRPL